MRRTRWLFLIVASLLTGCGILPWNIRPPANPSNLYPEDLQESPQYVEKKEVAEGSGSGATGTGEPSYGTSIHARFYKNEVVAQGQSATSSDYRRYMESGMAYSNELCDRWFDDLERVQARADYGQGSFAIGGSFATTTMGIFSAASNEIAAVAAAFGGVGSWYELGKAVFLFTPDLHIMRSKIAELRAEVRTKVLSGEMPPTYDQTRIQLNDYHQLCSSAQVKEYLDKAIVQTRYTFNLAEQLSGIEQAQAKSLGSQFSEALGLGNDSPDLGSLKRVYLKAFAKSPIELDAADEIYFKNLKLDDAAKNDKAIVLLKQLGAVAGFDKEAQRLKIQEAEAAELQKQKDQAEAANRSQPSQENQEKLADLTKRATEATRAAEATRKELSAPAKAASRIVVDVVPIISDKSL